MYKYEDFLAGLKQLRLSLNSFIYSVALASAIIEKDENHSSPYITLTHDGFYKIGLPAETDLDVEPIDLIVHELQHLLRLHLYRGALMISRSDVVKKFGRQTERVMAEIANIIFDLYINSEIGIYSDKLITRDNFLNEIERASGVEFTDLQRTKLLRDVNTAPEKLFRNVDAMLVSKLNPETTSTSSHADIADAILERVKNLGSSVTDSSSDMRLLSQVENNIFEVQRSAGTMSAALQKIARELFRVKYDILSFLKIIMSYGVTNKFSFTRRKPPRRPNSIYGITNYSEAARTAIAVDSSGSVDIKYYVKFMEIADNVASQDDADILFMIFDSDVVYSSKEVPREIKKTNGGTRFMPAINYAIEKGYDKLIMLTDMANFDTVTAKALRKIEIIYIMMKDGQQKNLSSEEKPNNLFYIDGNTIVASSME